jgi:hypothetical protein
MRGTAVKLPAGKSRRLCCDDGIYNNSGPLEARPGAGRYQCSGDTLRESFPTGGSDQLTRVSR